MFTFHHSRQRRPDGEHRLINEVPDFQNQIPGRMSRPQLEHEHQRMKKELEGYRRLALEGGLTPRDAPDSTAKTALDRRQQHWDRMSSGVFGASDVRFNPPRRPHTYANIGSHARLWNRQMGHQQYRPNTPNTPDDADDHPQNAPVNNFRRQQRGIQNQAPQPDYLTGLGPNPDARPPAPPRRRERRIDPRMRGRAQMRVPDEPVIFVDRQPYQPSGLPSVVAGDTLAINTDTGRRDISRYHRGSRFWEQGRPFALAEAGVPHEHRDIIARMRQEANAQPNSRDRLNALYLTHLFEDLFLHLARNPQQEHESLARFNYMTREMFAINPQLGQEAVTAFSNSNVVPDVQAQWHPSDGWVLTRSDGRTLRARGNARLGGNGTQNFTSLNTPPGQVQRKSGVDAQGNRPQDLTKASAELKLNQQNLKKSSDELAKLAKSRAEEETKFKDRQSETKKLQAEVKKMISENSERVIRLSDSQKKSKSELQSAQNASKQLEERRNSHNNTVNDLESQLNKLDAEMEEARGRDNNRFTERAGQRLKVQQELKKERNDFVTTITALQNSLAASQKIIKTLATEDAQLQKDEKRITEQIATINKRLEDIAANR